MGYEIKWENGWQVFKTGELIPGAKVQQIGHEDFVISTEQGDVNLPGRIYAYVCLPGNPSPIRITPEWIRS